MKEIPMEVLDMKNVTAGWSECIIPGAVSPGYGVAPLLDDKRFIALGQSCNKFMNDDRVVFNTETNECKWFGVK